MEWSRLVSARSKIRDAALITHAIPARRLRRILPKGVVPETFENPTTGEELAFISVSIEHNRYYRSAVVALPYFNFWQISYRAYAFHKEIPSAFYLGTELDTWPSYAIERFSSWEAVKADIQVEINRDASGGYDIYECQAASERGILDFYLSAKKRPGPTAPFANGADKDKFFHQRFHHLFKSSAGVMGDRVVSEKSSNHVKEGELLRFQCDYWVRLGLLKQEEVLSRFHNLLVSPSMERTIYPTVPSMLMPHSA